MRIENGKAFKPVHIVLESQEEVDKMFALFNHGPISNALQLGDLYGDFPKTEGYGEWHVKLDKLMA